MRAVFRVSPSVPLSCPLAGYVFKPFFGRAKPGRILALLFGSTGIAAYVGFSSSAAAGSLRLSPVSGAVVETRLGDYGGSDSKSLVGFKST
jgi:hypothetical protein